MNLLIIEDEQNAMERLEKMITEIAPDKKISGKCGSIKQTIQWLNENEYPDLILSDVQLEDGLSFDIFEQLEKEIPIIFISAYDKFAIDAFKLKGLHYLLKPVKRNELREAIDRYDSNAGYSKPSLPATPEAAIPVVSKSYQERFIIHVGSQIRLIHDNEIAYIFTESKVVYIVTFSNQKLLIDISLEAFEKLLNPALFYRINRQFIVGLKSIQKMTTASKQRIELVLAPTTTYETITSFERTPQFRKWLLGES